jgi:multidrug efflux system outer membrane protein
MRQNRLFMAAALIAMLSGCITVGPDYKRPKVDTPDVWPGEEIAESVPARWWHSYNDPILDRMIEEALVHNTDLALAIARVDEARALVGIVRADQFPGVTAGAAASRNRISEKTGTFFAGIDKRYTDYTITLNASWEIDLWGKFRRATEAARADLFATESNRDAVRLALIAAVSQGYFNLRALDAQVEVTRKTIETRLGALDLQRKRFEAGATSELELHQVEAETATAQALLPALENRLSQQETALSVLLGRSPRDIVGKVPERGEAIDVLTVPPAVPAGLPSDLLERRPDLRQAEQQLVSANARIGQAKAAYFPSISLTGLFGTESATLANLFTAPAAIWQMSASAAQLIFDSGRTRSQVKAARARQQQAVALYQGAIQDAFKDTLDALVAQRKARARFEAEQVRVAALRKALALAKLRYENGISSLLDVLDAERGLLNAQLDQVEAQQAQLDATADLFKAMGGGWEENFNEKAVPTKQAQASEDTK